MDKKVLHSVIDEVCRSSGDKAAIEAADASISYKGLRAYSNRIACCLAEDGVKPGAVVATYMESGIDYVCSILGAGKAGAVFMPLEMSLPEKRLEYLLQAVQPEVMITSRQSKEALLLLLSAMGGKLLLKKIIVVAGENAHIYTELVKGTITEPFTENIYSDEDHPLRVNGDSSNYLIYTSGSTGTPKIMEGMHKSLSHFMHWEIGEFQLNEQARVSQLAPLSFDASFRDIFVPLVCGGTLCIPAPETRVNPGRLIKWIAASGITMMHTVPSVFRLVTKELKESADIVAQLRSLKHVLLAGEPLYGKDLNAWRKVAGRSTEVVNLYGPSETTLIKTFNRLVREHYEDNEIIPLGNPISNTTVAIINGDKLCGLEAAGEIHIKTPFRTKGYYKDESLTREKFVQNPLHNDYEDIVYRTGDWGKYLKDKSIAFISRQDTMVKIRGNRVELSEVESVLRGFPGIKQVITGAVRNANGEEVLACYFIEESNVEEAAVKAFLREYLPEYMHPSYFIKMEKFPVNHNGKTDRKALPRPEELLYEKKAYEAPSTATEQQLALIYSEILGLKKVSVTSSFFEMGGHSLTATRVVSRIFKALNKEITLKEFFDRPAIRTLAAFLDERASSVYEAIPVAPAGDLYMLSHPQKRLWILSQFEGGQEAYHISHTMELDGEVDVASFVKAFDRLLERHEILRTTFVHAEGDIKQRVHAPDATGFRMEYKDLCDQPANESAARTYIRGMAETPFDLEKGPLLRVLLLRMAERRYLFSFTIHHIIADGWSIEVLFREILHLYTDCKNGRNSTLPKLGIQYKDYAVWQQQQIAGEKSLPHGNYWHSRFSDEIPLLDFPADYSRPPVKTYSGQTIRFKLDKEISRRLNAFSREKGVSLFMALVATVKALLFRYTGQEDIVLGTPIAGRDHKDLENQIGFYVNMLPLRTRFSGDECFEALLEKVKETTLGAFEHKVYPFDKLVDELALERDMSRSPLFDVMVVLQNVEQGSISWEEDVFVKPYEDTSAISKYDLSLIYTETEDGLDVQVQFNTDLYKPDRMERFVTHYKSFVASLLNRTTGSLKSVKYLSEEEETRILKEFNEVRVNYSVNKTIQELFQTQAAKTPESVALYHKDLRITYGALNEKANKLAYFLRNSCNVKTGDLVGIMADRSEKMIIALLGILKSGAAYVPVDPSYPAERIRYMLEDSKVKVLLADTTENNIATGRQDVILSEVLNAIEDYPAEDLPLISGPEDPAYVIYTSGSTGTPKGVEISLKSLTNYLLWANEYYFQNTGDHHFGLFTSLSFDLTVTSIFSTLLRGDQLVIYGNEAVSDILRDMFTAHPIINAVKLTPAHIALLPHMGIANTRIRTVIAGGEALTGEHIKTLFRLNKSIRIFNEYGPTEATVGCTVKRIKAGEEKIRIGKPVGGAQIYILDGNYQLCPVGVTGEICVGGTGLARGYLNKAALTKEKFIYHPFLEGEKLYRTGDLGRWQSDGDLEFFGRKDHQVKLRGYRIELAEIEQVLESLEGIEKALVVMREESMNDKYLAAYFTAQTALTSAELRSRLSAYLPSYMIPSHFMRLKEFPLTANGKIDRKALPLPSDGDSSGDYTEARTEMQALLVRTWEEVLGRKPVGIRDNFFHTGGDSIKAIQIASRLYKQGYKAEVRDIFRYPSIEELTAYVKVLKQAADQSPVTGIIPLTPVQHDFFASDTTDVHHYNQSLMLHFPEGLEEEHLRKIFSRIQEHHDALRMVFTQKNGIVVQENKDQQLPLDYEIHDLKAEPDASSAMKMCCNKIQSGIRLEEGPLMKLGLFQRKDGDHLLIAVHHLVVDGISWRILLEDINTLYRQCKSGEIPVLPLKTDSFKTWSEVLQKYATSESLLKERSYWSNMEKVPVSGLPVDFSSPDNKVKDAVRKTFTLSEEETLLLLTGTNQAFGTEVNDILVTAFGLSIQKVFSRDKVFVTLEGHGRESIAEGVDVSRTVGWFTTSYPVLLEVSGNDLSGQIKGTKERLRIIPSRGIGYGVLKYLTPAEARPDLLFSVHPAISFNYMGQFDTDVSDATFKLEMNGIGNPVSPERDRGFALEVIGMIAGQRLSLTIVYNAKEYKKETIDAFGHSFTSYIRAIINHCSRIQEKELTPSDMTYSELSMEELDRINELFGE